MTFKEARKEAKEIAQRTGYWGYIFKDKSGEWFTSDCNNFTSDNSFYVNKAGKILNMQKYEKIKKKLDKQGIRGLCLFSPELMKYIEQHGDY